MRGWYYKRVGPVSVDDLACFRIDSPFRLKPVGVVHEAV